MGTLKKGDEKKKGSSPGQGLEIGLAGKVRKKARETGGSHPRTLEG